MNTNKHAKTKIQQLNDANEWFKLHDIQSFVYDDSLYVVVGDGFEVQLSSSEVSYRAGLLKTK